MLDDDSWAHLALTLDGAAYRLTLLAWADAREEQGLGLQAGLRALASSGERPGTSAFSSRVYWHKEEPHGAFSCRPDALPLAVFVSLQGGTFRHPLDDSRLVRVYKTPAAAYLAAAAAYEVPVQQEVTARGD